MPNASSDRSVRPHDGTFRYCNYHRSYLLCVRAAADFPRLHPRLNRRNNRAVQRFACAFPQHAVPVIGIYCRIEERAFPGNNSSPFHKTARRTEVADHHLANSPTLCIRLPRASGSQCCSESMSLQLPPGFGVKLLSKTRKVLRRLPRWRPFLRGF